MNRLQEDKRLKISTKLYTFEAEYRYGERLILTSYDQELFSTLHDLESSNTYLVLETHKSTDNSRLTEYFCSATQCLTLVITFSSVQRKVNELKVRQDFNEFRRRMRTKWYFRNQSATGF